MPIDATRWQRLSPWLDQVLDLPTERRGAWLDDLAERDAALAAELRALLAGSTAGDAAQVLQGAAPALEMSSWAGRRIGAYTLLEPLGEGGMGSVWLAERSDGRFEGRAAVKLLHAGLVQRALAERFRREGAILARLTHPHIARLVDAGLTEDGQPFLVLEHVAGERIDRWCDARQMDLRGRIALFAQVLQAVQHAHAQLVVHRDLKPANVMVDGQGEVKLLDFGIAKLIDDEGAAEATELTRDAGRVLTPLYAAPEQTRGDSITIATDVYALGLLLYLLLTGQHPRVDARGQHAAAAELPLASRVVADSGRRSADELQAAAAARNTTPARLAHALAGDLDNILAKALRAEPGERYATVASFADDLQRHLDGLTVSARPDSWAYRASRFVKRHRAGVALATLALAAIATAAGVAEHQRREAEYERDLANRQRENAEAIVMFLGEQLSQVNEPGLPADPGRRLDLAQRRAEQLFRDTPEVLVQLYGRFHDMNSGLGRIEAADRILGAIESTAGRSPDPILRAEVLCGPHRDDMRNAEAVARIDRGLALLDANTDATTRSRCLFHRSSHMKNMARFDEALRDLDAAQQADPALLRRLGSLSYLRGRARLLNELGQVHAAERAQSQLIEQMQAAGLGNDLQMRDDLHWRCIFQWRMGRPREALQFCEQARRLAERAGNTGYLRVVDAFRARMLQDLDQPQAARRLFEDALVRDGRLEPPFPRGVDFIARLHHLRGNTEQAVAVLESDIQQHGNVLHNAWDTINRFELAAKHIDRGDSDRALAALAPLNPGFAERTFRWDRDWLRARAHNLAGRPVQAEAAARAALDDAGRRGPPDGLSSLHGQARLELARALAAQGLSEESRVEAQRAQAELADSLGTDHFATRAAAVLVRQ
ncbi:MAG: serine/threonine protein kinase [Burkholderiales bacterium]|nr:serine/threonine protein kinase [Burkholderiales bacterium]